MTKAIPERRGDYDTGRTKDALTFRAEGVRAAMFVNEVGTIGCAVDLPTGGAIAFSMEPAELIQWLRERAAAGVPASEGSQRP